MSYAEEYRRKARDFLILARRLTDPHDRTELVSIAAFWMERAEDADRRERIAQQTQQIEQQQQPLPEDEPEAESS